jgi:hypothetical protein
LPLFKIGNLIGRPPHAGTHIDSPGAAVFLLLAMLAASGCTRYRPCDPDLMPDTGPVTPPNLCRLDGCTLSPDFDFSHCCDAHDASYWAGGSAAERKQTDRAFSECVATAGHDVLATVYYIGVRIGGTPYLPTPWRWGFGWDYPQGYSQPDDTQDPATGY